MVRFDYCHMQIYIFPSFNISRGKKSLNLSVWNNFSLDIHVRTKTILSSSKFCQYPSEAIPRTTSVLLWALNIVTCILTNNNILTHHHFTGKYWNLLQRIQIKQTFEYSVTSINEHLVDDLTTHIKRLKFGMSNSKFGTSNSSQHIACA